MKFTTETSSLNEAIKRLGFAVNTKSVVPAIQNILVTVSKGEVLLTTTDLQVTVNYRIECETEAQGQFLMPFTHLKNIVALETGKVKIEWMGEPKGAIAKFEQDVFGLGMPAVVSEFPKIPTVSKKGMIEVNSEFITALKMAAIGVSKDENRPVLHNICIEMNKEGITVTSTDSFTIFTQFISQAIEIEEKIELLVPAVVAKVLEGAGAVKLGYNKNHMAFEAGQVFITCKRAEGVYPAWRGVMQPHDSNLNVKVNDLRNAVEKAYVMSDSTYNRINLFLKKDQVQLKTEVQDTGMSCDCKIAATSEAEIDKMAMSGRLLKRMITQLESQSEGDSDLCFSIQKPSMVTAQISGKSNVTVLIMCINWN